MDDTSQPGHNNSGDTEGAIDRLYDQCPLTVRVPWLRILRRIGGNNPLRLSLRSDDESLFVAQVRFGLASKLALTMDGLRKMDIDLRIPAETNPDKAALAALQRTILAAVQDVFPDATRVEVREAGETADRTATTAQDDGEFPAEIIAGIIAGLRNSDRDNGFADSLKNRLGKSYISPANSRETR